MTDSILQGTMATGSQTPPKQQKKAYDPKRRRAMLDMLAAGEDPKFVKYNHVMHGFDSEEADDAINTYYQITGQQNPIEQQTKPAQADLSGASALERQSIADTDATINMANEALDILYPKEQKGKPNVETGVISGNIGKVKQMLPGGGDERFNQLNMKLANIKANFMKALSGAAVSEQEVKRLSQFLPSTTDQEEVIKLKLESLKSELSHRKDATYRSLGIDPGTEVEKPQQPSVNDQAAQWLQANPDDPRAGQVKAKLESLGYYKNQESEQKPSIVDPDTGEVKTSGFFEEPKKDLLDKAGSIGEGLGSFFGGNQWGKAIGDVAGSLFARYGEAGETFKNTIAMITKAHQEGKLTDEQYEQQLALQENAARDAYGYDGPSWKQLAADTAKIALSVTGGPALKGATAIRTGLRVGAMGFGQGALEEVASEKDATLGGVLGKGVVGLIAAPLMYGGLAGLGKIINIATGKNALLNLSKNTAKAIGMTGKMTAASSQKKIPEAIAGLSTIAEEADGALVKDIDGVEKAFVPSESSFGETIQALVTAKNNIYKKYTGLAKQAGDAGASVTSTDIEKVIGKLQEEAKNATGTTKGKVASIIGDIMENFGKNGKLKDSVDFESMQKYIEALNVDVNPMSDKAGAVVSGKASKFFRDVLDDKISKATGQEYQMLRNKYASIKGIEDLLVNQFKKSARGTGSGVADWVSGVGGADMLAGLMTSNPGQFAKGAALTGMSKLVRRMRDPETALKSVFKVIEKQAAKEGGYSGIAQRAAEAQGFGIVGKTAEKVRSSIIGKAKSIRPGMNIQDVSDGKAGYSKGIPKKDSGAIRSTILSKKDPLLEEARKYKSAEEFVKSRTMERYYPEEPKSADKFFSRSGEAPTEYANDDFSNFEEVLLSKNAKIAREKGAVEFIEKHINEIDDIEKRRSVEYAIDDLKENNIENYEDAWYTVQTEAKNLLKKQGYDGVNWYDDIYDGTAPNQFQIWNESAINYDKSQLTDIWNKAQPKKTIVSKNPLIERNKNLSPEDRIVEDKAIKKVEKHQDKILKEYDEKYGKVVNADNFKKVFIEDGYVGTNSAAVHEASSYLSKKSFTKNLKNEGKYATFTMGQSGSGKSSALSGSKKYLTIEKKSAVILDSNLSNFDLAIKKITEAEKAGKKPIFFHVFREPVDALENGVVKRMLTNKSEMGRVVPTKTVANNAIGSWEVAKKLHKMGYKVVFIDNSLGAKKAKETTFDLINNKIKYTKESELVKIFNSKIKELYGQRKITRQQYEGYIK